MKKVDKRQHLNYRIGDHIVDQRTKKNMAKNLETEFRAERLTKRRSDIQITPKKINRWLNK